MDLQEYLDAAYVAIYQNLPQALPEFEFEALDNQKGYKSSNNLKIDGTIGSKKGAVYVYANSLFGLKDYTRGFVSIYNYLKSRDHLDHKQVLQKIAELSGLKRPKYTYNSIESDAYNRAIHSSEMLEATNSFFIACLSHIQNDLAQSSKARQIRNYLIDTRGYHVGHIQLPEAAQQYKNKMELGFATEAAVVYKHLQSLGYTTDDIHKYLKLPSSIGKIHILSIPYRNKSGIIKGFAFRTIQTVNKSPKYLYSSGLQRGNILFNLRGHRPIHDLVIVEGILDALNATANGLPNVVALGGAQITDNQLKEILSVKPTHITLCLDTDLAGQQGTLQIIKKLLPFSNQFNIYVAQLPNHVKDLDELIAKDGIEYAKTVIYNANSIAKFLSNHIINNFKKVSNSNDPLSDKLLDSLIQQTIETETTLKNPLDAALFRKEMLAILAHYTITPEILAYKTEALQEIKAQKVYLSSLEKLHHKIGKALKQGQINQLEDLFQREFRTLKISSKAQKYEQLTYSQSEEELRQTLLHKPKALYSGYTVELDRNIIPIMLPAGAISFFCAPTSHGKTTMLINLALNIVNEYPNQQVHIFSYEESKEPITLKAFNAYLDLFLGENNIQIIENYFRTANLACIQQEQQSDFYSFKEQFFKELILSKRLNIHYVDYDCQELIEAIHYLHKKEDLGIILIDYMQLLSINNENKGRLSRQEELKRICINLKDCAIETGLPLVLGAQFNREVVNPFRVHATKIGEAGDIERIASVVVGMWNNDFEPTHLLAEEELKLNEVYQPNTIWLKLLKNRTGKVGGQSLLSYNGNKGKIYPSKNRIPSNNGNSIIKF